MSAPQAVRQPTRVSLSLGSTTQTGEFQFSKIMIGLERDVASLENPLDAYRDINALLQRALQDLKALPAKPNLSTPEKSQPPAVAMPNGLKERDATHSATPLEKAAESLRWGKSTNNPARQWTKIKDAEESLELKQVLTFVREHAMNGYATIGSHVYRIEGDFLGRYPKREAAKQ